MQQVRNLLIAVTALIPAGEGQHHNITLDDSNQLVLTLVRDRLFIPVILEEGDLTRPANEVAAEILTMAGPVLEQHANPS